MFTGTLLVLTALAAAGGAASVITLRLAFLPVLSLSMSPTLGVGDLAITRAVSVNDLRLGDVVVLPIPDAPGQRYTHRIVELTRGPNGPVVTTKGDNNTSPDAHQLRITSTDVPVVIGRIPTLGRVALAGQHTWIRISLILLTGTSALLGAKRLTYPSRPATRNHRYRSR
jgi:signal peptidase